MAKTLLFFSVLFAAISSTSVFAQTTTTTTVQDPPLSPVMVPKKKKIQPTTNMQLPMITSPVMGLQNANDANMQALDIVNKITQGNQAMQQFKVQNSRCYVCELNAKYHSAGKGDERADEAVKAKQKFESSAAKTEGTLVKPENEKNSFSNKTAMCGSRPGDYDVCIYNGDVVPGQIRFADKKTPRREWEFDFPNRATQDMGLTISDVDDNALSKSKETYIMVFPRRFIPSIRIEGDKQIVTLPTGEEVVYDKNTKKVLSGALNNDKQYTGEGISVRVDRTGNDPRLGKGNATLTNKKGKSCAIPLKSLWPDQSQSSALHFNFATDTAFDGFLKSEPWKKKCGFGVFD